MASFSVLGVDIQPLVLSIESVTVSSIPKPTWKSGAYYNSPVGR